jgi:hypothetical protein
MIIGWWAVLGWQSCLASVGIMTGTMIQGAAILANTLYHSMHWRESLLKQSRGYPAAQVVNKRFSNEKL